MTMGFFDSLYDTLTRLFCGTPSQQGEHPVPQKPPPSQYSPSQQQQQPQYPPPQRPHSQPLGHHVSNGQSYGRPHSQSPPLKPYHGEQPPSRPDRPSQPHYRPHMNQINQQDEYYMSLRTRANMEGDQMAKCFEESHEAYARKDGARAKELSNQGKEHKRRMEELNSQASEWIFTKNNEDSRPGEIDLHGLYVKEALTYTDRAIEEAKRRGESHINLIVGKGLHSSGGIAKLKPAIEELMQKHQLLAELDPDNTGVLIVQLTGQSTGRGHVIDANEVSRRLEKKDQGCVIM